MPSILRAKMALVALFAILLIPIYTPSLRGLTHILTCDEQTDAEFAVQVDEDGEAILSSSQVITREDDRTLCGGLLVDFSVGGGDPGHLDITMTITNTTEDEWHGTVSLEFDGIDIPVGIGAIDAGDSAEDTVSARIRNGQDYEIQGRLLIGP
jgi:hypothetical protein